MKNWNKQKNNKLVAKLAIVHYTRLCIRLVRQLLCCYRSFSHSCRRCSCSRKINVIFPLIYSKIQHIDGQCNEWQDIEAYVRKSSLCQLRGTSRWSPAVRSSRWATDQADDRLVTKAATQYLSQYWVCRFVDRLVVWLMVRPVAWRVARRVAVWCLWKVARRQVEVILARSVAKLVAWWAAQKTNVKEVPVVAEGQSIVEQRHVDVLLY